MKRLAIFASGNGSNFEVIVNANLNCEICLLVCNNRNAYVLKRAKKLGIDYKVVEDEEEILKVLANYSIDLVVLAGYMKIFSPSFVNKFERRIINIHPSLLPNYRGLNAIERAFNSGEKEIGVSIHYVDSGVDTGEVIASGVIQVGENDSLEDVEKKVHELEHFMYPKILEEIL